MKNIKITESLEPFLYENIHSLVIWQRDKKVYENYFTGEDSLWGDPTGRINFSSQKLHDIRSITKSIVAILYGIAHDTDAVPGINESVINAFPECADECGKKEITMHHILSMTDGLQWSEKCSYDNPLNDEIGMERSGDRYRYILSKPFLNAPGVSWNYSGGCTAILGGVISRYTEHSLSSYAQKQLLAPLDIKEFSWYKGIDGVDSAASGLRLTAPDLMKIGQLVLNRGKYNNKQIVSENWIQAMLSSKASTGDEFFTAYGYHWFLGYYYCEVKNKYFAWHAALGNGGQVLFICPSAEAVVVILSGEYNMENVWERIEDLLSKCIIPHLINNLN